MDCECVGLVVHVLGQHACSCHAMMGSKLVRTDSIKHLPSALSRLADMQACLAPPTACSIEHGCLTCAAPTGQSSADATHPEQQLTALEKAYLDVVRRLNAAHAQGNGFDAASEFATAAAASPASQGIALLSGLDEYCSVPYRSLCRSCAGKCFVVGRRMSLLAWAARQC